MRDAAEEWRPIAGFPGYRVSSLGRVLGLHGRVLSPSSCGGNFYLRVGLFANGRPCTRFVHHLVVGAFIGPRPPGLEIDHIDGDRRNAALSNLEYVERAENLRRSAARRIANRPPCSTCQQLPAMKRGRCATCAEFMRRTGRERPAARFAGVGA